MAVAVVGLSVTVEVTVSQDEEEFQVAVAVVAAVETQKTIQIEESLPYETCDLSSQHHLRQ